MRRVGMESMRHFLGVLIVGALTAGSWAAEKKLIEFGWDEPDPDFMREQASQLERSPFHGCVFHVDARKPDGGKAGSFTWDAWGTRQFTMEELAPALKSL